MLVVVAEVVALSLTTLHQVEDKMVEVVEKVVVVVLHQVQLTLAVVAEVVTDKVELVVVVQELLY